MSAGPRILIVGGAGESGTELQRRGVQPDVILNAAAYTAVDRAETERELTMAIHAEAPRVLAEEARRANASFVRYQTDDIFDGTRDGPWIQAELSNARLQERFGVRMQPWKSALDVVIEELLRKEARK